MTIMLTFPGSLAVPSAELSEVAFGVLFGILLLAMGLRAALEVLHRSRERETRVIPRESSWDLTSGDDAKLAPASTPYTESEMAGLALDSPRLSDDDPRSGIVGYDFGVFAPWFFSRSKKVKKLTDRERYDLEPPYRLTVRYVTRETAWAWDITAKGRFRPSGNRLTRRFNPGRGQWWYEKPLSFRFPKGHPLYFSPTDVWHFSGTAPEREEAIAGALKVWVLWCEQRVADVLPPKEEYSLDPGCAAFPVDIGLTNEYYQARKDLERLGEIRKDPTSAPEIQDVPVEHVTEVLPYGGDPCGHPDSDCRACDSQSSCPEHDQPACEAYFPSEGL